MIKKKNILINASNLHTGGGIQVAVSFIQELSLSNINLKNYDLWVSSEVDRNLAKIKINSNVFANYKIVNTYGFRLIFSKASYQILYYDLVFTIFGPLYLLIYPKVTVTGFAQAWIIYPENEVFKKLNIIKRITSRLKFFLLQFFFKKSNYIIVESDHVKTALINKNLFRPNNIFVVRNCISNVYFEKEKWLNVNFPKQTNNIRLGYLGRNYLHKNTSIFPKIVNQLKNKYNFHIDLYVTFNESEWENVSDDFKNVVINIGELEVLECPSFYSNLDGVIFTSLLECFSVTPLEALFMGKVLFASDRDFVRDICGHYAYYFDPNDVNSISDIIFSYFQNSNTTSVCNSDAINHAKTFSSAKSRCESYIKIINKLN